MADTYTNFKKLSDQEALGKSYVINYRITQSDIAIIAPHGGRIEDLTSELSNAIASDEFSFYSFEGILGKKNSRLHITSENFDEPQALGIVSGARIVVALHGRRDKYQDEPVDPKTIWLGGLDTDLIKSIEHSLNSSEFQCTSKQKYLRGKKPRNICNRGTTKAGVQLEIPFSLRMAFRQDSERFLAFVEAVRAVLRRH